MAQIITSTKVNSGVKVGSYGNEHDGGGYIGYVQPACEGAQWIIWFEENGDAILYTEREPDGGVVGEGMKLKAQKV